MAAPLGGKRGGGLLPRPHAAASLPSVKQRNALPTAPRMRNDRRVRAPARVMAAAQPPAMSPTSGIVLE